MSKATTYLAVLAIAVSLVIAAYGPPDVTGEAFANTAEAIAQCNGVAPVRFDVQEPIASLMPVAYAATEACKGLVESDWSCKSTHWGTRCRCTACEGHRLFVRT